MKKLLSFILAIIMIWSCNSIDENSIAPDSVEITGKRWNINEYLDKKNRDRTSKFSGYTFQFNSDQKLEIFSPNNTLFVTGTWKIVNDSGREKFYINIPIKDDDGFSELNEDWKTKSRNSEKIELENVSGGGGGTDILIFKLSK